MVGRRGGGAAGGAGGGGGGAAHSRAGGREWSPHPQLAAAARWRAGWWWRDGAERADCRAAVPPVRLCGIRWQRVAERDMGALVAVIASAAMWASAAAAPVVSVMVAAVAFAGAVVVAAAASVVSAGAVVVVAWGGVPLSCVWTGGVAAESVWRRRPFRMTLSGPQCRITSRPTLPQLDGGCGRCPSLVPHRLFAMAARMWCEPPYGSRTIGWRQLVVARIGVR